MKQIFLLLFCLSVACQAKENIKMLWLANISPDREIALKEDPFWSRVHDFITAAAQDLNIDLDILYYSGDYIGLAEKVEQKLRNNRLKPDLMIYHNHKKTAKQILDLGEKYKVKSLIFNAGISQDERKALGNPGEKYKEWICEMLPNDKEAGYILLNTLVKKANQLKNKPLEIIAIAGSKVSGASIRRLSGLEKALNEDKSLVLNQIFYADWSAEKTYNAFDFIMGRYPNTSIFWTASDKMAMSIVKRGEEKGLKAGKDFSVGGIDWIKEVIPYIEEKRMTVSVGGHYVEGAWALIVAYDYLNGKNIDEINKNIYVTNLYPITADKLIEYKDFDKMLSIKNINKIDFRKFSKKHNRSLKNYDFNLEKIIVMLKNTMENR